MPDDGRDADPLVDHLRPAGQDLAGSEELIVMSGYLGDGADGKKRIYTDAQLDHYIEFPEAWIRWREQIDSPDEYGARSAVWLPSAALQDTPLHPEQAQEAFAEAGLGIRLPDNLLEAAIQMTICAATPTTNMCSRRPCPK